MKNVLKDTKFIPSKRQPANLGNMLTKAKFVSNPERISTSTETGGNYRCNDPRCGNCIYMNETKSITITSTGKTFIIKPYLTCKSRNVLYIITCNGCKEQYVGMTTCTLAMRFNTHRLHIRKKEHRQLGVSQHLDECNSKTPEFTVAAFYKFSGDKVQGLAKEQQFIKMFQPSLNKLTLSKS